MTIYSKLPEPKNQHYLNRYIKLMKWASTQSFDGYTEKHHIIPDCYFINNRRYKRNIKINPNFISDGFIEGNPDNKNNLVKLTGRLHFIAHYLLYKAYDDHKMSRAFEMLSKNPFNTTNYFKITSKQYQRLKEKLSLEYSINFSGARNPNYSKCSYLHHCFGRKMSAEHKQIISETQSNKFVSQETRDKISKALKGNRTEETNQKIRETKLKNGTNKQTPAQREINRKAQLGISKGKGKKISEWQKLNQSTKLKGKPKYKSGWNITNIKTNEIIFVKSLYAFSNDNHIPYYSAHRYATLNMVYDHTFIFEKVSCNEAT